MIAARTISGCMASGNWATETVDDEPASGDAGAAPASIVSPALETGRFPLPGICSATNTRGSARDINNFIRYQVRWRRWVRPRPPNSDLGRPRQTAMQEQVPSSPADERPLVRTRSAMGIARPTLDTFLSSVPFVERMSTVLNLQRTWWKEQQDAYRMICILLIFVVFHTSVKHCGSLLNRTRKWPEGWSCNRLHAWSEAILPWNHLHNIFRWGVNMVIFDGVGPHLFWNSKHILCKKLCLEELSWMGPIHWRIDPNCSRLTKYWFSLMDPSFPRTASNTWSERRANSTGVRRWVGLSSESFNPLSSPFFNTLVREYESRYFLGMIDVQSVLW